MIKQEWKLEIPKEIRGLWAIQYEPMEKALIKAFEKTAKTEEQKKIYKETIAIYQSKNWRQKIMILDNYAKKLGL